ncbi:hypothetical protein KBD61_00855 [Patescibacteria group bacterium]|nr:hypothetical protein [Patescibacteria group bacterium]MBP9709557.1 hypothetical protein [Patescibacteria group bacterium]
MTPFFYWFLALLALEVLSALTIFHAQAQTVVLVVVSLVMFCLAWRRPTIAVGLLLSEYVIGSKGALLRGWGDGLGHGGLPLRMAWFGAFFLGWLVWAIQNKTYLGWKGYLKGRSIYVALGCVLVYAFLRGMVLQNVFVFADANAWGTWLLLLPALDLATHRKEELKRIVPSALLAAFSWLCLKTLVLFYLFTHLTNPAWVEAIYLWVRRTGVGEMTRALEGTNAWRVFFQSHVFLLPVVIGGVWYAAFHAKLSRWFWVVWIGGCATLIVSLSRSLFLGAIAGLLASIVSIIFRNDRGWVPAFAGMTEVYKVASRLFLVAFAALLLVAGLFYAPPRSSGSLMNLLVARTNTGDAASMSRWKLLPILFEGVMRHPVLGSGFGATVTYRSSDPRVVAQTGGLYTTYAFEWGWVDHWFKFGIMGIPLLLALVLRLGANSWRSPIDGWLRGALVCSLVGLVVTHVFTPYLNHPLGIAMLISLEAVPLLFNPPPPHE